MPVGTVDLNQDQKPKLLTEQQNLFIAFLHSVTEPDAVVTVEARNFSPEDLRQLLETIKTSHSNLGPLIKLELPPIEQCSYTSAINNECKCENKIYTQEEYAIVNELLSSTFQNSKMVTSASVLSDSSVQHKFPKL